MFDNIVNSLMGKNKPVAWVAYPAQAQGAQATPPMNRAQEVIAQALLQNAMQNQQNTNPIGTLARIATMGIAANRLGKQDSFNAEQKEQTNKSVLDALMGKTDLSSLPVGSMDTSQITGVAKAMYDRQSSEQKAMADQAAAKWAAEQAGLGSNIPSGVGLSGVNTVSAIRARQEQAERAAQAAEENRAYRERSLAGSDESRALQRERFGLEQKKAEQEREGRGKLVHALSVWTGHDPAVFDGIPTNTLASMAKEAFMPSDAKDEPLVNVGGVYTPRSQAVGQTVGIPKKEYSVPPPAHVKVLQENPSEQNIADFVQKYGEKAAREALYPKESAADVLGAIMGAGK